MKFDSNTIIFIIVTIVVAGGGYYWYSSTQTGNQPPLSVGVAQNEAQSQFKVLVSELQAVTFDTTIFSDPNFMALVDLATPVTPEAPGRTDPFAAISVTTK
jgi:hypothetical protein